LDEALGRWFTALSNADVVAVGGLWT
jgi:hypothetical protein